jgi:hypothetical protein
MGIEHLEIDNDINESDFRIFCKILHLASFKKKGRRGENSALQHF